MLNQKDIWQAIDRLALINGLSTSGLARKAGLDPTSFNPSKRFGKDGRPRWPSMESIHKILFATQSEMADFLGLFIASSPGIKVPLRPWGKALIPGKKDWDNFTLNLDDPACFALEIEGNDYLPLYRDGDALFISPNASLNIGDKLVIANQQTLFLGILLKNNSKQISLASINNQQSLQTLEHSEISWLAKIIFASQ